MADLSLLAYKDLKLNSMRQGHSHPNAELTLCMYFGNDDDELIQLRQALYKEDFASDLREAFDELIRKHSRM